MSFYQTIVLWLLSPDLSGANLVSNNTFIALGSKMQKSILNKSKKCTQINGVVMLSLT
jgi:hypothetical protein